MSSILKGKYKHFDSLDLVELTMALEEAGFSGPIQEKDLDEIVRKLGDREGWSKDEQLEVREAIVKAIRETQQKGISFSPKAPSHLRKDLFAVLFWLFIVGLAFVLWKMASS